MIIPTLPQALRNFGGGGTYLWAHGSGNTFIFPWGKQGRKAETYQKYYDRVAPYRAVARGKLEFRGLGPVLRMYSAGGKISSGSFFEAASAGHPASVQSVPDPDRLGILFQPFLPGAFRYLGAMFGSGGRPGTDPEGLYLLVSNLLLFVISAVCCTPAVHRIFSRAFRKRGWMKIAFQCGVCVLLFFLCIARLVTETYNPFLYFRF